MGGPINDSQYVPIYPWMYIRGDPFTHVYILRHQGRMTAVTIKACMKVISYLKHSKSVRIVISEVTHIISMQESHSEGGCVVGFSSLPTSCLTTPREVVSIITDISSCSDPASSSFLSFYSGIHDRLHSYEKEREINTVTFRLSRGAVV